jgi:hypothetical protein
LAAVLGIIEKHESTLPVDCAVNAVDVQFRQASGVTLCQLTDTLQISCHCQTVPLG